MYEVILQKEATKQLGRLEELWRQRATEALEDLANDETRCMKYSFIDANKQLDRLEKLSRRQATEALKWLKTDVGKNCQKSNSSFRRNVKYLPVLSTVSGHFNQFL
ncbi:hypothetical protein TNIN_197081 [Trichonephila inaurata madagascariensis]|uniref:Uncharacterized protein n=1 Tax=Trichonephila inaurata madagascariensis TaxID=2747483 RepID=A0A8X7CLL2_9ARAC|nr:hypothetical protein TNIN_197081 [Trichonephila inaurata madagascariensis]